MSQDNFHQLGFNCIARDPNKMLLNTFFYLIERVKASF